MASTIHSAIHFLYVYFLEFLNRTWNGCEHKRLTISKISHPYKCSDFIVEITISQPDRNVTNTGRTVQYWRYDGHLNIISWLTDNYPVRCQRKGIVTVNENRYAIERLSVGHVILRRNIKDHIQTGRRTSTCQTINWKVPVFNEFKCCVTICE